jgi:hypothetical protein
MYAQCEEILGVRAAFGLGLTQKLRGAALGISEAIGNDRRPLERPVRLAPERLAWKYFLQLLGAVFAAEPWLSDGVTTSRAMACANGRDCWRVKARPFVGPCCAWIFQRFAHCSYYFPEWYLEEA